MSSHATTLGGSLPWDWYPGTIPSGASIDATAYIETTFSFLLYRSRLPVGVSIGRGASTYLGTMFDVGPAGSVRVGEYALLHGVRIVCDSAVEIGDHSLLSWNVVLMDTYRASRDVARRRSSLERAAGFHDAIERMPQEDVPANPVRIESNVWIGFDACVLPGVTVGEGAVIGAKSVVFESVPPYTIAAGNPARVIRDIGSSESRDAVRRVREALMAEQSRSARS